MGQFVSDLFKDSTEEVKEQLEILQEIGNSIMESQSQRMAATSLQEKNLPIVAVTDTVKRLSMHVQSGVSGHVSDAVDSLFKGQWLDGLKEAVSLALEMFLGNAKAGRQEYTEFHVVYANAALLRIDLYFYLYNFPSGALKDHSQNMFCYVAQVGVLDAQKVNPEVVLYEIMKHSKKDIDEIEEKMLLALPFFKEYKKGLQEIEPKNLMLTRE